MRDHHYKSYLLFVLTVIYAFNNVDRLVLGLVLQDIKVDLHLSDTNLGVLTGIAFGLFYAAAGIPIARWADRGNRVTIISVTTALWSLTVALGGLATSFLQLMVTRIAAAVGEAGCVPPAHSLIAVYFPRAVRPRAFSRYSLATPVSVVLGYLLAGWLNQFYGWRITFMLLGLPGLALAAVAWFTLREPRRQERVPPSLESVATPTDEMSLKNVCLALWANTSFRYVLIGYSVASFFGSAIQQWQPAFFVRSFGLHTGELGTWFTVIGGACGLLGTYLGGELGARHAANNEGRQLKAVAVAYCGYAVISIGAFLSSNYHLSFALMGIAAIAITAVLGPLFGVIQTLVPQGMRAMSIAVVFLFANVIGGLGPVAAGMLSDALRPLAGEESLRYALVIMWPGYIWGAWYLWRASTTVPLDLHDVEADLDRAVHREADEIPPIASSPNDLLRVASE